MKDLRIIDVFHRLIILFFLVLILLSTSAIKANAVDIESKNVDLVILFNDNVIDKNIENIISQSGGRVLNEVVELGSIEIECNPQLIPTLISQNSVKSLAPNHTIKMLTYKTINIAKSQNISNSLTDDLYYKNQWDIKKITNNGQSFNLNSGNHKVVVGIIDSGVDVDHPDLVNNLLGGRNLVPAMFKKDFSETGDTSDINDRIGHGTQVAGDIAGNGRIKGIAPNIGFKSYRIFNKNGETNATIVTSAIIRATNDGVKVINLSLGEYYLSGKCYWTDPKTGIVYKMGDGMAEYSLYKRAIKYASDNGVTVVSAAGNEKLNCSNKKELTSYLNTETGEDGFRYVGLTYEVPGTIKGVINVSATTNNDEIASYSNFGKDFIDIAAPGGDFSDVDSIEKDMCLTTTIGDDYAFIDGTSIAAPKVAAVAALIICKYGNLAPKNVAKKIYTSAEILDGNNSSKYFGHGLVSAYNALTR